MYLYISLTVQIVFSFLFRIKYYENYFRNKKKFSPKTAICQ